MLAGRFAWLVLARPAVAGLVYGSWSIALQSEQLLPPESVALRGKKSFNLILQARKHLTESRLLRGRKVDAHHSSWTAFGVKERARCKQVTLVQHASGQRVCVDAAIDSVKEFCGFGVTAAAMRECQLDAAGARQV
jgi:hypothetical protein